MRKVKCKGVVIVFYTSCKKEGTTSLAIIKKMGLPWWCSG